MKKYIFKIDTMKETELQRVCKFNIYPGDPKLCSDKGFVNIDNGSMRGTHWIVFIQKIINHTTLIVSVVSQINFY